ncbi:hypothetical protein LIER_33736 [Lithospermum erythrorhizon]|uniref:Thaumatin-like protein 1 n=1 Tax=Lithospermum erythrorhizon TaxID=34254 RepID=A0AAV3RXI9_LITER
MYSQLFKSACPKSYSYAYDDASSTFTCTGADYTITFCPSGTSKRSSKSSDTSIGIGSDTGAGSDSGSGLDSGSGGEAMLADGSWLANLATGDSMRIDPLSSVLVLALIIVTLSIGQFMQL